MAFSRFGLKHSSQLWKEHVVSRQTLVESGGMGTIVTDPAYQLRSVNELPRHWRDVFYQGLGFKTLGPEYLGEAIQAFEKTIQLNQDYTSAARIELIECYVALRKIRIPSSHAP